MEPSGMEMRKRLGFGALILLVAGCGAEADLNEEPVATTTATELTFEEFKATLPIAENGYYVVEWDLLMDEEQLHDYWSKLPSAHPNSLIINEEEDGDRPLQSLSLTYCFDNSFTTTEKNTVKNAIDTVRGNWSEAAGKTFWVDHYSWEDGAGCTNSNSDVFFNVRKITGDYSYAFLPGYSRSRRELEIAGKHIVSSDFHGIMRHEFGHIYGFRHEQDRQCPEGDRSIPRDDRPYHGLTRYDRQSVMHYPGECGKPAGSLGNLSTYDKHGARCAYSGDCEWVPVSGGARDIGVSANGQHVWIIGQTTQTGGYGVYRYDGSSWDRVTGGGVAIAVEPGGNAWIVNNEQNIYRYNGSSFVQVSGKARDVAVGANGRVWIIGNDSVSGGYSIHRRKTDNSGWDRISGGGVRITVDASGNAWIVNNDDKIYQYGLKSDGTWGFIAISGLAKDISMGSTGRLWIIGTGTGTGGYDIYERVQGEWVKTTGRALRISAGDGAPWIVNDTQKIYYNRWE